MSHTNPPVGSGAPTIVDGLQDLSSFTAHRRLKRDEMFDDQFIDFMRWLRNDLKGVYTREDFQDIERGNMITLLVGYAALVGLYGVLHQLAPEHAWLWGAPMFAGALYCCIKAEVIHMRTHVQGDLTGSRALDTAVDYLGLALSGVSPNLFRRRHLAAHYNDVGTVSKLFSSVWLTFDKVPIIYYLKPWLLIRFLMDPKFCKDELIDRRQLVVETFFFYGYLAALVAELWLLDSYFLLVFHLIPGLWVAGSQIVGAAMVHSGADGQNTFESNGLFDPREARGLIRVPLWWFGLFNANFFINHAIHHAWPQLPLPIINQHYRRWYDHILSTYHGVRYNTVLSQRVHAELLGRLPAPGPLSYAVAFLVTLLVHVSTVLAALGLPFPPVIFELAMVDWRVFFYSTRRERMQAKVAYLEGIGLPERFASSPNPNTFLRFYHRWYLRMKGTLAAEGVVAAPSAR